MAGDAGLEVAGWKILYGAGEEETRLARAALSNSVQRLPTVLSGLV